MFRKLPSKKPDTTVFKEISKEFSPYFQGLKENGNKIIKQYPKQVFIAMIILIVVSAVFSFVILPGSEQEKPLNFFDDATHVGSNVMGEAQTVIDMTNKAHQIYQLQKKVEDILQKEKISADDSLFLEKAIIDLELYNKQKTSSEK